MGDFGCSALSASPEDLVSESEKLSMSVEELLRNPKASSVLSNASYLPCQQIGAGFVFEPVNVETSIVSEVNHKLLTSLEAT